jgi:hypothetical protein
MEKVTKFTVVIKAPGSEDWAEFYPKTPSTFTDNNIEAMTVDTLDEIRSIQERMQVVFPFAIICIVIVNIELIEQVTFDYKPDLALITS